MTMLLASGLLLAAVSLVAGNDVTAVPYDVAKGQWLFDPEGLVARNDVLYTAPSAEPWEAMPTGGDLSAMVRWDGSLHLHLQPVRRFPVYGRAGGLSPLPALPSLQRR